ncbi:MAG: DNA (cytosine-5-)-methyltransferase [Firmicutes bacterium]|nr:DNA (cytosine-5-)-methyltransferase [Bacillota bacterium]
MDFCAGIGAGRLGLQLAGGRCVGHSEILQHSLTAYNILHSPTNECNFGDLTQIECLQLPNFDLMIAGFPCQTFSVVGKRQGFLDNRGQIIYHLVDILKAKQIKYFILENVKGLVNHDKGKTIHTILQTMREAGYSVAYKVLNSLDYGVPQMRERVYFVGIHKSICADGVFEFPTPCPVPPLQNFLCGTNNHILDTSNATLLKYLGNKYNARKFDLPTILQQDYLVLDTRQSDLRLYEGKVPTLRTGRHGILYVKDGKLHKLSGLESLLLQGFSKEMASKLAQSMPEKKILEQAGNAMTVTVITAIAKKLFEYLTMGGVYD